MLVHQRVTINNNPRTPQQPVHALRLARTSKMNPPDAKKRFLMGIGTANRTGTLQWFLMAFLSQQETVENNGV